jgi:hypothetical protein
MKKTITFALCISLAVTLSGCDICLLFGLLMQPDACGFGNFITSINKVLYSVPAPPPPPQSDVKTPLPPQQIVGEPISSEPGGSQQDETAPSSFKDIITSPSFTLGPGISWLGGDKEDGEKFPARLGFQMGATWQVPVTDRLNFEPGLSYAHRSVGYESEEYGYEVPGDGTGGSYSYTYGQKKTLHYLEMPLFVNGSVMDGLDLYGGPQVAFLLGAKVVNESNGQTTSTEKGTDGLNKVDLGLAAGARYRIPNTFFSVSLGYYHGLSNLNSKSEYAGYGYDEPKYRTRAARLGIQYNFPAARSHARSAHSKKAGMGAWISK